MASINKRTSENGVVSYQAMIRRKGFPTTSKTFATEKEARVWAQLMEESMAAPVAFPKFNLSDYIDRFEVEEVPLKNPKYKNKESVYLKFWRDSLGERLASSITSDEIEKLADSLLTKTSRFGVPYTLETRRKYIQSLGCLYNIAIKKWRWCTVNPVAHVNLYHDQILKQRRSGVAEKEPAGLDVYEWKKAFMEKIGAQLESRGMPQGVSRALVALTGISKTTLQQFFDLKQNVTLLSLLKLARALDISIEAKAFCSSQAALAPPGMGS